MGATGVCPQCHEQTKFYTAVKTFFIENDEYVTIIEVEKCFDCSYTKGRVERFKNVYETFLHKTVIETIPLL